MKTPAIIFTDDAAGEHVDIIFLYSPDDSNDT